MANEEIKKMPESYAMSSGDGPHSYFQNSSYQKVGGETAHTIFKEAINDQLDFNNPIFQDIRTINIADFGCSVGPNTFTAVKSIIESIELKHKSHINKNNKNQNYQDQLEYQVYFNDQASNDFNTLFQKLPNPRNYFAAGVPGSFCEKLFPKSTLQIGHSSFSLHWLSKVPQEVMDPNSPAFNKESIQSTGYNHEVARAYSSQFKKDIDGFLNARAHEIMGGGLLLILIMVVPDGLVLSQTKVGFANDVLGACLIDMAQLGLISKEKVEEFNIPFYPPSMKELKEIIVKNEFFDIVRTETMPSPSSQIKGTVDFVTSVVRAVNGGFVERHFGPAILDPLFDRFGEKLAEKFRERSPENYKQTELVIVLKRNMQ